MNSSVESIEINIDTLAEGGFDTNKIPDKQGHQKKLKELSDICNVYHDIAYCPALFLVWHRDWKSLQLFFYLEHPISPVKKLADLPVKTQQHTQDAWSSVVYWMELLLCRSYHLRKFGHEHNDWLRSSLHQTSQNKRIAMLEIIKKIDEFQDDFRELYQRDDPFWSGILDVDPWDFPYITRFKRSI
jgi:hypothetical protein